MSSSSFLDKTAVGGAGSSGFAGGDGIGGGISLDKSSTATITGIVLSFNQVLGGAGGAGQDGGTGAGGGIAAGARSLYFPGLPDNTSVTLSDALISGNLCWAVKASLVATAATAWAAAPFVGPPGATGTPSLAVSYSLITENSAVGGWADPGGSAGQGIGGGVYSLGTFSDVVTLIINNHASTSHDNVLK